MPVTRVQTSAFEGQRPGTSGLRKQTSVFEQPGYVENFVQSVLDAMLEAAGGSFASRCLVIGGDGRYFNRRAIQTIVRIAAANGFGEILVGRDGLLSTPAASAVIRRRSAFGGLILSASHNPGGPQGDFGIKYNIDNGGPAPEKITERIYRRTREIDRYLTVDSPDVDLENEGEQRIGESRVRVIDPLADYVGLMHSLFDFDALRRFAEHGATVLFDAMHAVTGPYARRIFEDELGFAAGTVLNGTPSEDFGGGHPDPNLAHASELVAQMREADAPLLGAASDGDGDRNMILGRDFFVSPGDSLAIIAEHAAGAIPGYRDGLAGVARSMPTSCAIDRVAESLGIPCFETPTGWKFFGNLMDAGKLTICGEESFGTGSSHVREKDGLWAVLCWLSILAHTGASVENVVREHWRRFGRSYYSRHDYEELPGEEAAEMIDALRAALPGLVGSNFAGIGVKVADDFCYRDPVDRSVSERQGIRLLLADGSRVVCRLSGTGTAGATLRLYLERYDAQRIDRPREEVLAALNAASLELLDLRGRFGREQPTVTT
jgi:phosphoglucomutase